MKNTFIISALSLWLFAVSGSANLTLQKWNTYEHEWKYIGIYRCYHAGTIQFFSNSEISRWRVAHYNEHQQFDNFTRLWVRLSDGTYFHAYTIESLAKNRINFESNTALQQFLGNLTN